MTTRRHRLATQRTLALAISTLFATPPALAAGELLINEFSASTASTDVEYVELVGAPNTAVSGYTLLEIEGDSTAAGTIDSVIPVDGTTNPDGLLLKSLAANELENGSMTLLLVKDFSGAAGDDLDTDNDGTLDATLWREIVDSVAINDGGSSDLSYGPTLGRNYDGISSFAPGGASRLPDGVDTDSPQDWVRNDFDLAGIAGQAGSLEPGEALNTPGLPNATEPTVVGGQCGDEATPIHAIQGSGATFALGGAQSVEAVVTALMPGLRGFYIQEEASDEDGDPTTSEGLFVFTGSSSFSVAVGDRVRVNGTVIEYTTSGGSSMTEMSGSPTVQVCGSGETITPSALLFPLDSAEAMEAYEGMLVQLPQELLISEYFNFDRYGEVVIGLPPDGQSRFYTPTAVAAPGADANQLAADYATRRLLIDDGRSTQNPTPPIHPGNGEAFTLNNRFRGGDTVSGITGVVDETFGRYRLQPTGYGTYLSLNDRPDAPADVGGNVRVASMNVLNYFLSLDNGADICGAAQDMECRGADTAEEFTRQREKILSALAGLDADVIGLIEMENTPGVEPASDLVAGLNDRVGTGTYAFIDTGVVGTDAIRVGLLYKPARVSPVGSFAVLDSSVDAHFIDDKNRPALAQTFASAVSGERFTVAVNHLKSKGSDCNDLNDPDLGDGQGNCNLTRTAAAQALADWLASDPTASGSTRTLVIGDLNSYTREDPITALRSAGYTNLLAAFGGDTAYSYVFDGQAGYLDHALANASLAPAVTGTTVWHINADEPDLIDYDMSFKADAEDALYAPNAYRSSDHDPVLVGLDLIAPTLEVTLDADMLWPPNHRMVEVHASITASDDSGETPTVKLLSVTSNEPDNGHGDGHTHGDIVIIDNQTIGLRAERSGRGQGREYTLTYTATDAAGNTTIKQAVVSVPRHR